MVAATFTVSLSAASGHPVSVDFASANESATAPADYSAVTGTLNFDPGESSRTVTVQVKGDALDEVNETFVVNLSGPANATIADGQGRATIIDDDLLPTLAVDDVTIAEGDTGTAVATFTVTLSPVSGRNVSVNYATTNGTAAAPGDYAAIPTTAMTFAPGETTKQVSVLVNGDTLNEADETFSLNLSNPTSATVSDPQGQGTITNDDPLPTLAIHDVTVTEGNTGTVGAAFTVSLNTPSARIVTVNYATAPGSATSGTDYQAASGSLTFLAGQTSKTITVLVNGDVADEEIENFFVNLSSPDYATIADAQGIGTILDNDGQPALSINDMTVTEGQSGTVNVNFTVTLAPASGQTVTVGYATADGTATAGSDYVAKVDNLVFSPTQTTKTLTVQVNGDLRDELEETFTVTLSGAINATIDDAGGNRHDYRRRSTAHPGDRQRHGGRGQLRHYPRNLHGEPRHPERAPRLRRLRDRERNRDLAGRLRRRERHAELRARRDDEAGTRARHRRHARRDQRDLHRRSHKRVERDDRRPPGHRHDHRRRRGAAALGQRRRRPRRA